MPTNDTGISTFIGPNKSTLSKPILSMDWYEPDEDTYTLMDALESEGPSGRVIVDLGTSTGVIAERLEKRNTVISIDLNMKALLNHRGGNLIRADLLCCINQELVDIVVFNPPYVPDTDDPIIGGGPLGRRVIDRFIGSIDAETLYLLVIEANRPKEVLELLRGRGYRTKVLRVRKILGETLYIVKGEKGRACYKV